MSADKSITNVASLVTSNNGAPVTITSNTVTGIIKDGILYTKAWEGEMYRGLPNNVTLTQENKTKKPNLKPMFVDILDDSLLYITGSAKIDGVAVLPANVSFVGGVLSIKAITDCAAGATMTCTFQVLPS